MYHPWSSLTDGGLYDVQVNNCDCKVCVVTHNLSVTVVNYTHTCLVTTSRDIYSLKPNLNRNRNMASVHFIGLTPDGVS